jgi:hypothetical protein
LQQKKQHLKFLLEGVVARAAMKNYVNIFLGVEEAPDQE